MSTRSEPGDAKLGPSQSAVMSERRRLLNLAYRLLGSLAEAEDVVQEAFARWYAMTGHQRDAIASPGAWLTTVASRICSTCSAQRAPGGVNGQQDLPTDGQRNCPTAARDLPVSYSASGVTLWVPRTPSVQLRPPAGTRGRAHPDGRFFAAWRA
jgi:hypothetical protein